MQAATTHYAYTADITISLPKCFYWLHCLIIANLKFKHTTLFFAFCVDLCPRFSDASHANGFYYRQKHITFWGFSHDVTKILTRKLLILLRFYFRAV